MTVSDQTAPLPSVPPWSGPGAVSPSGEAPHPHCPVAICKALGLKFEYIYPPIPDRRFDWGAYWDDGEPVIAYGRTQEQCAWKCLSELEYIQDLK